MKEEEEAISFAQKEGRSTGSIFHQKEGGKPQEYGVITPRAEGTEILPDTIVMPNLFGSYSGLLEDDVSGNGECLRDPPSRHSRERR